MKKEQVELLEHFVNALQKTDSIKKRCAICKYNRTTPLIMQTMEYICNIKSVAITRKMLEAHIFYIVPPTEITDYLELLSYLQTNTADNDSVIVTVQRFLRTLPESKREFFTSIICKDVRLGLGETNLNNILKENI